MRTRADWPVLTTYRGEALRCVAMPLGGIGTGTISLGGRGDLRDWELVNRPAKGFKPRHTFFALWARPAGGEAVARALEGAILPPYEGEMGARQPNHGLPRFRRCVFHAAYPLAQVLLADPSVPLRVRLEAFNPLIPADPDRSGIPVAVLRFVLRNDGSRLVRASVCGSLENFIGSDGTEGRPLRNVNDFRSGRRASGVAMRSEEVRPDDPRFGTMALVVLGRRRVSYRTAWARLTWGDSLLDFWDDFLADGRLEEREAGGADAPVASLAVPVAVPPRAERAVTFLLTWHFPNRTTWTPRKDAPPEIIGNYYATQYADAWDVAERTAAALGRLERETVGFVQAVCRSDFPAVVKEAALYNLTALRSQTSFRTADGRFFGWEGCRDRRGCCHGSCTHVWNYEQATAFLFGSLARSMRQVEFLHATDDRGLMSFRVNLPLERAREQGRAAADGQMGCLMKLYRDWQLSGDDDFLRSLWPAARRALEFAWVPGGWDADRDGVMEGCQHNTMDVEYYGPNPQMGGWYLGALRAAEEIARHLGEDAFADECRRLFESGSRWLDANLFNGEYYEHHIRPATGPVADGLRSGMGSGEGREPDFQLGAGCLVDQLVGQFVAHVCGLGYLLRRDHVRKTLRSILRYNFRREFYTHFNHLRSFVLNDDSGLLMATYPRGRRPRRPFPYFNEVMTGFEYSTAVHMLYEGQRSAGLRVIEAIRRRYDGARRNPFDEAECGHHYARAMASWAAMLALSGFRYSGVEKEMVFTPSQGPVRWFWSNGWAWGECLQRPGRRHTTVEIRVLGGRLHFRRLVLSGYGAADLGRVRKLGKGTVVKVRVSTSATEA